jgi:hypothetical protein
MQEPNYDIKFVVDMEFCVKGDGFNHIDFDLPIHICVVHVYVLFELIDEKNYQFENDKNRPLKLVIKSDKWKSLALTYISENNLTELMNSNAAIVNNTDIHDTEADAKIQLAFFCAKHLINSNDVYQVTKGQLDSHIYDDLVKMFYEDFPEKFV